MFGAIHMCWCPGFFFQSIPAARCWLAAGFAFDICDWPELSRSSLSIVEQCIGIPLLTILYSMREREGKRLAHLFSVNAQWNTNYSFITMVKTNSEIMNLHIYVAFQPWFNTYKKVGFIPGIRFESLDVPWCLVLIFRRPLWVQDFQSIAGAGRAEGSAGAGSVEGFAAQPQGISRRSSDLSNARNREELATKKVWKSVMNLGILLILFMET